MRNVLGPHPFFFRGVAFVCLFLMCVLVRDRRGKVRRRMVVLQWLATEEQIKKMCCQATTNCSYKSLYFPQSTIHTLTYNSA